MTQHPQQLANSPLTPWPSLDQLSKPHLLIVRDHLVKAWSFIDTPEKWVKNTSHHKRTVLITVKGERLWQVDYSLLGDPDCDPLLNVAPSDTLGVEEVDCFCSTGAVRRAIAGDPSYWQMRGLTLDDYSYPVTFTLPMQYQVALEALNLWLNHHIRNRDVLIVNYNDNPEVTHEDIRKMFMGAISDVNERMEAR